jgi:hexosaminidase
VGHPEIGSAPGPYQIERKWGIFDPTLDPTNEKTYALLDAFLGEMAALFPDPYLHIGGDENNGKHWDANPQIQEFKRAHQLKDNHDLQAYFNQRVLAILQKHGKRMIGWDEIFHPDLPKDAVIHSWRGPDSLAETARQGYQGILSNGYYIDLMHPAREHYLNDPIPGNTTLTPEQQARILGGEATMWAEWVTPETIDSRIWPRTAAIAERLWSPRDVRDVDDMYRRLGIVHNRLEELGLSLTKHVDAMLRRFAGEGATAEDLAALRALADLVEPVKGYTRGQQQPGTTQYSPLTTFADCARADSAPARELTNLATLVQETREADDLAACASRLTHWYRVAENMSKIPATRATRAAALAPLLKRMASACQIGIEAVGILQSGSKMPDAWRKEKLAALDAAAIPHDACELPFIPALRRLVAATAGGTQ